MGHAFSNRERRRTVRGRPGADPAPPQPSTVSSSPNAISEAIKSELVERTASLGHNMCNEEEFRRNLDALSRRGRQVFMKVHNPGSEDSDGVCPVLIKLSQDGTTLMISDSRTMENDLGKQTGTASRVLRLDLSQLIAIHDPDPSEAERIATKEGARPARPLQLQLKVSSREYFANQFARLGLDLDPLFSSTNHEATPQATARRQTTPQGTYTDEEECRLFEPIVRNAVTFWIEDVDTYDEICRTLQRLICL